MKDIKFTIAVASFSALILYTFMPQPTVEPAVITKQDILLAPNAAELRATAHILCSRIAWIPTASVTYKGAKHAYKACVETMLEK